MKTCRFCAEEILDAAIVCKHCQRDLVETTGRTPASAYGIRRWIWIIVAVLVCGYFLVQWSRGDYLEFAAHREDWHRRCDAYISAPAALGRATQTAACKAELDEMMAYANQQGWR